MIKNIKEANYGEQTSPKIRFHTDDACGISGKGHG
jgi:hypothetical protein